MPTGLPWPTPAALLRRPRPAAGAQPTPPGCRSAARLCASPLAHASSSSSRTRATSPLRIARCIAPERPPKASSSHVLAAASNDRLSAARWAVGWHTTPASSPCAAAQSTTSILWTSADELKQASTALVRRKVEANERGKKLRGLITYSLTTAGTRLRPAYRLRRPARRGAGPWSLDSRAQDPPARAPAAPAGVAAVVHLARCAADPARGAG